MAGPADIVEHGIHLRGGFPVGFDHRAPAGGAVVASDGMVVQVRAVIGDVMEALTVGRTRADLVKRRVREPQSRPAISRPRLIHQCRERR